MQTQRRRMTRITFFLLSVILMSGCTILQKQYDTQPHKILVTTEAHPDSPFNSASALFIVDKSRRDTMMFLSNTAQIPSWMAYVDTVTVLDYIDHNNFVIRADLDLPWPFKTRELVACISTRFEEAETIIDMKNCAERAEPTKQRIAGLNAQWRLRSLPGQQTEVQYHTWISPGGLIPASGFNLVLKATTHKSLTNLRELMHRSSNTSGY